MIVIKILVRDSLGYRQYFNTCIQTAIITLLIGINPANATPDKQRSGNVRISEHPIAADFASRANQNLSMFGNRFRDSLTQTQTAASAIPLGQISDDYVLGTGDRLVIRLRGARNTTTEASVDRSGAIALDEMAPIMVAGSNLGEFRRVLQDELSSRFLDTKAFVTIASLRQITVTVTGSVALPGPVQVSSLATPLDALKAAGGIESMGSLRAITLEQQDGYRQNVDLYQLLLGGDPSASRITLNNGDRLHVPPIGMTVGIAGAVKRPAVFDLGANQDNIDLKRR